LCQKFSNIRSFSIFCGHLKLNQKEKEKMGRPIKAHFGPSRQHHHSQRAGAAAAGALHGCNGGGQRFESAARWEHCHFFYFLDERVWKKCVTTNQW